MDINEALKDAENEAAFEVQYLLHRQFKREICAIAGMVDTGAIPETLSPINTAKLLIPDCELTQKKIAHALIKSNRYQCEQIWHDDPRLSVIINSFTIPARGIVTWWIKGARPEYAMQAQSEPLADAGAGRTGKKKQKGETDRLRTEHFIEWAARTNYDGSQIHYWLQDELRKDNSDLWGKNKTTFDKWLKTSEAIPARELLIRLKLAARQAV